MSRAENLLIEKIRERLGDPMRFVDLPGAINKTLHLKLPPPVTLSEMELAEKKLGFRLPSLLRALYLQIGNGGFGPGYGLIGLDERGAGNYHINLVDGYIEGVNFMHPDYPPWPKQFLVICNWGDNITSVLDWAATQCPVYRFNGDRYAAGPFESAMDFESPSLQTWLEDWLNDRPLFKLAR